jgi:hypothetical protein
MKYGFHEPEWKEIRVPWTVANDRWAILIGQFTVLSSREYNVVTHDCIAASPISSQKPTLAIKNL